MIKNFWHALYFLDYEYLEDYQNIGIYLFIQNI